MAAVVGASGLAAVAWLACDPTGSLSGTTGAVTYGPGGAIVPVTFTGGTEGATINFTVTPSTLSVSPASATASTDA
jgi:hypothetical protein